MLPALGVAAILVIMPAPPDPAGHDANLLGGPTVADAHVRTLIRRAADGTFEPVDGLPEAAALVHLDLDESQMARALDAVQQRRVDLALLLVAEIDTVQRIIQLVESGEPDRAARLLRDLRERFEPGPPRDALAEPLATILTPLQLDTLAALLNEYWEAWIDWELRDAADRARGPRVRAEAMARLSHRVFEAEVRAAYQDSLARYREVFDSIVAAVEPTPAQREKLRAVLIEHLRTTRLNATPDQRREALLLMYRALDDRRREKLFELLLRTALAD